MHRLRADAQPVVIALQRNVFPAPAVAQFDERAKLLRPVTRNPSADSKYSQALLTQQSGGKVFEVFKRIEGEAWLSLFIALAVGQGVIEAKFGIGERRHEHRNIFLVRRFQNA